MSDNEKSESQSVTQDQAGQTGESSEGAAEGDSENQSPPSQGQSSEAPATG